MSYRIISAAEAASYVKHGMNIGLSGFTPAGAPKAVTPEIARIAEAEHAAGRPYQIGIFTGASTGDVPRPSATALPTPPTRTSAQPSTTARLPTTTSI